jgi:hypothetical protein
MYFNSDAFSLLIAQSSRRRIARIEQNWFANLVHYTQDFSEIPEGDDSCLVIWYKSRLGLLPFPAPEGKTRAG